MIKLIDILKEAEEEQNPKKIFIPRRIEQRNEKRLQIDLQKIQKYIDEGCIGDLDLSHSPIIKLPDNLTKTNGFLNLYNSKIKNLNNLERVNGYLSIRNAPIESLGNLKWVDGDFYALNSSIQSLGNLEYIGGNFYIYKTPLAQKYTEKQIREIVFVGGSIYI